VRDDRTPCLVSILASALRPNLTNCRSASEQWQVHGCDRTDLAAFLACHVLESWETVHLVMPSHSI
jgi:hypothetical protein